jgi:hypothetical protein
MSDFPLFNVLNNNISTKKDLTVAEKNDFIKKIQSLDVDGFELIYALIKYYYIQKENGSLLSMPYNGVIIKDKIQFNLLDLPIPLRHIIYKFICMHKQKLQEDIQKEQ